MTAESPRWKAVGLVIDLNTRDHLSGRYGLAHDLVAWFKAIRLFRDAEDERMVLQDPTPADFRQHRTWLTNLISEGERLLSLSHAAGGLPRGSVPFTLEDVAAAIENLRTDERLWHSTISEAERAEVIAAVFNVAKS